MKKSSLKIGYLVEVRNGIDGNFGLIMPTTNRIEPNICRYNDMGISNLEDYNEDLICERRSDFDIVRVWGYGSTRKALTLETDSRQLLWERKEEEKVTIRKALEILKNRVSKLNINHKIGNKDVANSEILDIAKDIETNVVPIIEQTLTEIKELKQNLKKYLKLEGKYQKSPHEYQEMECIKRRLIAAGKEE